MNILSVNNTTDLYGASRCLERVFTRFVEGGHEVHVVLPGNGPLVELLRSKGIQVHIQTGLSVFDRSQVGSILGCLRFLLYFPISVVLLIALILRYSIDVVHTNTGVLPSSGIAAMLTGTPHVWHVRELFAEFGWLWKPYERYISLFSSVIIAISRCTRNQFDFAIRNRVHVIYDGLDETAFEVNPERRDAFRNSFPTDKLLVGVVGRIKFHRKGQEVLVRAARLLKERHPRVHYVIVGSTALGNEEHETRLRSLIASLDLENDFTFVGDVEDPMPVFAALDVAVVPSVQPEPFGCVVIEAMAVGTPVIGSRCGGIAEQIIDGSSGLLFTPGDPDALADRLERIINDGLLRERIIEEGLQRVHDVFRLEDTCRHTLALFDRVKRPEFRTLPGGGAL